MWLLPYACTVVTITSSQSQMHRAALFCASLTADLRKLSIQYPSRHRSVCVGHVGMGINALWTAVKAVWECIVVFGGRMQCADFLSFCADSLYFLVPFQHSTCNVVVAVTSETQKRCSRRSAVHTYCCGNTLELFPLYASASS